MTDETEAVLPLAAEDVVTPAVWSARVPDVSWCPAPLLAELTPPFIETAEAEPRVLRAHAAGWRVLGASVRGKSHGHRGEHRDDALASVVRDDLMVLAVADGAGSSAPSRIGAAVTADLAVTRTAARFDADVSNADAVSRLGTAMAHAVHDAAMRLHELATIADVAPSSLRTTLVLVALAGDLMLVSQVGDGAVLVQKTNGDVMRVGGARETAWAGEVTCFVPDPCAMTQAAALRQVRAADVSLIALMTDGIDDPFHPLEQSGSALVSQWRDGTTDPIGVAKQQPMRSLLGDADAMLQWMSFEQRGEVDDRTLLLAWRSAPVHA
ncbi:MAG: protein phosphatase 2C domain-containing protein [Gemmatimonadaceae bacterium]|nr:protein phosphatase 2C domain-containing protein [Gemmatimonadaceae bacterium]